MPMPGLPYQPHVKPWAQPPATSISKTISAPVLSSADHVFFDERFPVPLKMELHDQNHQQKPYQNYLRIFLLLVEQSLFYLPFSDDAINILLNQDHILIKCDFYLFYAKYLLFYMCCL